MKCINKECEYRVFNGGDDIGDFYYCELVGITVEGVTMNVWRINLN